MNVDVENLFQYKDTVLDVDREATYCISHDSDCGSDEGSNRPDYNFEELEAFAKESRREKLQGNSKYKIKEMRVDLKVAFNINAFFGKCKRDKRMILETLEASFIDEYKKLVGYANTLEGE
ncbi:hypothetical protein HAX54_027841 [Datura stramonium]|uniref:Uncharacterized protein n=1 Tax=Datura stramonium TaxID=4076 RepID=A0ABS8RKM4_DATST|nr:hypothetical protein [Datura stramonium]